MDESGGGSRLPANNRSATVARWVTSLAEDLAAGEYRFFGGEKARSKVDLHGIYTPEQITAMQQIYRQLLENRTHCDHRDIHYSNLRKEISAIAAKKPQGIVDVTSVKKTFLGDLVAASIIEGLDSSIPSICLNALTLIILGPHSIMSLKVRPGPKASTHTSTSSKRLSSETVRGQSWSDDLRSSSQPQCRSFF